MRSRILASLLVAAPALAALQAQQIGWPATGRLDVEFVAVAAGGGGAWGAGDYVIAFKLRR